MCAVWVTLSLYIHFLRSSCIETASVWPVRACHRKWNAFKGSNSSPSPIVIGYILLLCTLFVVANSIFTFLCNVYKMCVSTFFQVFSIFLTRSQNNPQIVAIGFTLWFNHNKIKDITIVCNCIQQYENEIKYEHRNYDCECQAHINTNQYERELEKKWKWRKKKHKIKNRWMKCQKIIVIITIIKLHLLKTWQNRLIIFRLVTFYLPFIKSVTVELKSKCRKVAKDIHCNDDAWIHTNNHIYIRHARNCLSLCVF